MAADVTTALVAETAITPFAGNDAQVLGTFGYPFVTETQVTPLPASIAEVMGVFGIRITGEFSALPGGDSSGGGGGGGTGGGIARPSAGMIYPRGSG